LICFELFYLGTIRGFGHLIIIIIIITPSTLTSLSLVVLMNAPRDLEIARLKC